VFGWALSSKTGSQGRLDEAEKILRTNLEAWEDLQGKDGRETLAATCSLARCVCSQRRLGEAEKFFRTALKGQERVLGPDHLDTLATRQSLADCLGEHGFRLQIDRWVLMHWIEEKVCG
jgi:hypothetical protein